MFTVVIEYNDPTDGLLDHDSFKTETLAEARAAILAATNLDCYVNPRGSIYDADNNRVMEV